ncbi:MAG: TadE/TadG family type IV pilus assembly protein [Bacillota bacterium]
MKRFLKSFLADENGISVVLFAIVLVVILGFTGLAVDIGVHAAEKRKTVNALDAAVLAGAHFLPGNTSQAKSTAINYANKNGITLNEGDISFENNNKRIVINVSRGVNTFFARVLSDALSTLPLIAESAAEVSANPFWDLNPGIICFKDNGTVELKGNLQLSSNDGYILVHSNGQLQVKENVSAASGTSLYGSAKTTIQDNYNRLSSRTTGVVYEPPITSEQLLALKAQAQANGQYFNTKQEIDSDQTKNWTGVVYIENANIEVAGKINGDALIIVHNGKVELKGNAEVQGAFYQFGNANGIEFKENCNATIYGSVMSLDKIELKDSGSVNIIYDSSFVGNAGLYHSIRLVV